MSIEEAAVRRIDALLDKGERLPTTLKENPLGGALIEVYEHGPFIEWRTQTLAFLVDLFPGEHPYVGEFRSIVGKGARYVDAGMGILRAIREDILHGYLRRTKSLIRAAVFTDFLDMSQHLLDTEYKDAAALLIAAVLEAGLRQIASEKGISLRAKEDLNSLNNKCADAEVYTRLMHKRIQVWTVLRNYAAHGNFGEYAKEEVIEMLSGVRDFLARYV